MTAASEPIEKKDSIPRYPSLAAGLDDSQLLLHGDPLRVSLLIGRRGHQRICAFQVISRAAVRIRFGWKWSVAEDNLVSAHSRIRLWRVSSRPPC